MPRALIRWRKISFYNGAGFRPKLSVRYMIADFAPLVIKLKGPQCCRFYSYVATFSEHLLILITNKFLHQKMKMFCVKQYGNEFNGLIV